MNKFYKFLDAFAVVIVVAFFLTLLIGGVFCLFHFIGWQASVLLYVICLIVWAFERCSDACRCRR